MWSIFMIKVFLWPWDGKGVRDKEMQKLLFRWTYNNLLLKRAPLYLNLQIRERACFYSFISDSILWLHCSPLMPKSYKMSALRGWDKKFTRQVLLLLGSALLYRRAALWHAFLCGHERKAIKHFAGTTFISRVILYLQIWQSFCMATPFAYRISLNATQR